MPLEPDAARLLEAIRATGSPLGTLGAAAAREQYDLARAKVAPAPLPIGAVRDLTITGRGGRPMPARLYRPSGKSGSLPVLLYLHGGGWVLGNLDSHDSVCRALAEHAGFAVLSPAYGLAPEEPFPAGLEDAVAALAWIGGQGAAEGLDPARIAVGGDSAGGNLAAALAILDRDSGRRAVRFQLLLYPATDFAFDTPSQQAFAEDHLLTRANLEWFRAQYLPDLGLAADWRASPLRVPDAAGLPPALILTAEYDPLRDEGEAFGERLSAAGVAVETWRVPGQIHGFLAMGGVIARAAPMLQHLGAALAASPAAG